MSFGEMYEEHPRAVEIDEKSVKEYVDYVERWGQFALRLIAKEKETKKHAVPDSGI
jgi:hypothetical protein